MIKTWQVTFDLAWAECWAESSLCSKGRVTQVTFWKRKVRYGWRMGTYYGDK